jgi:hypothetical protein
MITRTDAELIADVRLRSDLGSGQFRTDANIRRYLNESHRRGTAKLIALFDQLLLSKSGTINTAAATQTTALPADFFILHRFRVTLNNNNRVDIPRAEVGDLDIDQENRGWNVFNAYPKYRLEGTNVRWVPTPQAIHAVTIYYISTDIAFANAGTAKEELTLTNDYINVYWLLDQWVVLDAAIKVKGDQEEDISTLVFERDEIWKDFDTIMDNRAAEHPPQVRDVYGAPPGGYHRNYWYNQR